MSLPSSTYVPPRPAAPSPDDWLAPRDDLDRLARRFRLRRRVQVPGLLQPEVAQRLHARLQAWREWALVTRIQGQHRAFDAAGMDALDAHRRATFDELVAAEARVGFQYLYERFPLYERGEAGALAEPAWRQLHGLLKGRAFLDFARQLTGADIARADGQLTRYRRGHFLTLHDDRDDAGTRIAAFVLNLTPAWPADFGGQLQFADGEGLVEAAVAPRLNSLSVFAVPSPHLVTTVAPFAFGARYALTGWFHSA